MSSEKDVTFYMMKIDPFSQEVSKRPRFLGNFPPPPIISFQSWLALSQQTGFIAPQTEAFFLHERSRITNFPNRV